MTHEWALIRIKEVKMSHREMLKFGETYIE